MADFMLSLRNLLRNRRRSLSTLLALAIGLVAILLFGGFKSNIKYSMLTAYVRTGGHLQIQHADFYQFGTGNPTAYAIERYPQLMRRIANDPILEPMIAVVTPSLRISGIAGNYDAGVSRTVIGTGYVASDVNRLRAWNEHGVPITLPRFALEGNTPDAAVVGRGVGRVLQLCGALSIDGCRKTEEQPATANNKRGGDLPSDIAALTGVKPGASTAKASGGAKIELLASTGRGAPNVATLQVIAAEDQGFKELDDISVFLHLDSAQRLVFGKSTPKVTAIMVQLHRTEDEPRALNRIQTVLREGQSTEPLVVRTVEALNPFFVQSQQLFDLIFGFIFILIGGIVLFTVGNTMNAAVVERTVEIGTLRAIGLRRSGIQRLFVLEGVLLGLGGVVLGIVASLAAAAIVNRSGLKWLPPGTSELLPLQLRVSDDYGTLIGSAVVMLLVSALSAWWPAWRASKLKVVDALRHV